MNKKQNNLKEIKTEKLKSLCWDKQELINQLSQQLTIARLELSKRPSFSPKTSASSNDSKKGKKAS